MDGQVSMNGSARWYLPYLLLISGFGGLLAGVDFGIIAAALLYLDKTISLSEAQLSFVVAIYTGGGVVASLLAGVCADWAGRKRIMVAGGLLFVAVSFSSTFRKDCHHSCWDVF